jgi:hypothetical protein
MSKTQREIRDKDIYDLALILKHNPLNQNITFWEKVSKEFKLACKSRFIDCKGIETFEQCLDQVRKKYTDNPIIPNDISFEEAWTGIRKIVHYFDGLDLFPLNHPLPDKN